MNWSSEKKVIVHYYTYPQNSGGPLSYIESICNSRLKDEYTFKTCFQNTTLGKINKKRFKEIVAELETYSPDIIHIHGLQGEGLIGLLAARAAKVPAILMTVHGMQHNALQITWYKRILFKYIIEPYILRKSDAVYCVSSEMHNRKFVQRHTKKLLPYIHNFLPKQEINVPSSSIGKDVMNFSHDDFVVVIVGRVSIDKGMKVIEKCIKRCSIPKIKFLIIGEGSYKNSMTKKLYENRKNVVFTGQVNNVKDYLLLSDVYLSASLHENFSIALLEACGCGLPSIVTNVGDNDKIVVNEVTGYIVDRNNYDEILAKIYALYNDHSKKTNMGLASKKHVLERFTEEIFVKKLGDVYKTFEGKRNEISNS